MTQTPFDRWHKCIVLWSVCALCLKILCYCVSSYELIKRLMFKISDNQ